MLRRLAQGWDERRGALEEGTPAEAAAAACLAEAVQRVEQLTQFCRQACAHPRRAPESVLRRLAQGWDERRGALEADTPAEAVAAACLAETVQRVEQLGAVLAAGGPAFPTAHVALRMEQVAAGAWPERAAAAPDADERVPSALLEVRPNLALYLQERTGWMQTSRLQAYTCRKGK